MNQIIKKFFSLSLLTTVPFIAMNCKKEKKDNTPAMALAAVALSQSGAAASAAASTSTGTLTGSGTKASDVTNKTGSSKLVASKSLNVVSSQGINSNLSIKEAAPYISSMIRQATTTGIADKATLCNTTSGTLKDSEYCAFKPEVANTDPVKAELSLLDILFKTMGKTGYEWVVGKGNVKVTFTAPKVSTNSTMSSMTGGSSSQQSKTVQKSTWVINADYTNGVTPLVVKAWGQLDSPAEGGYYIQKADAKIKLTITEAKSDKNPLGTFELNADLEVLEPDYSSMNTSTSTSTGTSTSSTSTPTIKYVKKVKNVTVRNIPTADGSVNLEMLERFTAQLPKDMDSFMKSPMTYTGGFADVVVYRWMHGVFTPPKDITKVDDSGQVTFGYASDDASVQKTAETFIGNVVWSADYIYSKIPSMGASAQTTAIENGLKRKNPSVVVRSYGLFKKTGGSKFLLNSGFPIKSADGTKEGWAGRYGVNYFPKFDPNATTVSTDMSTYAVKDGEKVIQQKFDGTTGAEFSLKTYPGRLIRITKGKVPLNDLSGIEIDYWNGGKNNKIKWNSTKKSWEIVKENCSWSVSGSNCTDISATPKNVTIDFWYYDTTNSTSKKKAIRWDGVNSKFMVTATCTTNYTTFTDTCVPETTESELVASTTDFSFSLERINSWKANEAVFRLYLPGNGGSQGKSLEWNPSVDAANAITYTEREVDKIEDEITFLKAKFPSDTTIQALTTTITLRDYKANSVTSACYTNATDPNAVPTITPVSYKLATTNGPVLLKDDGTTEVTTSTEAWETDFLYRDRLVPTTVTFTEKGSQACGKLYNINQDVMYSWSAVNSTSTNAANNTWAKRTVLVDSNSKVVKFDLPVSFTYSDNDPKTAKGLQDLTYYGFGDLQVPFGCILNCSTSSTSAVGMPTTTTSTSTSTSTSSSTSSSTSTSTAVAMDKMPVYGPQFTIPDNKEITIKREKADGSGDEDVTFIVVQLEKEEYMNGLTDAEKQLPDYTALKTKKNLDAVSTSLFKAADIGVTPTDATKVCAVDGFPADINGNPLIDITSDANKAILACK